MKKLFSVAAMVVLLGMLGVSNAWSFSLVYPTSHPLAGQTYVGPVEFNIKDWTVGRAYDVKLDDAGAVYYQPINRPNMGLPDTTTNIYDSTWINNDGIEDTWGVVRVSDIWAPGVGTLWQSSSSAEITGILYGLSDIYIRGSDNFTQYDFYLTGGQIDLFLDTTPDADDGPVGGPSLRSGNTFPDFTDGVSFLQLALVGGVLPGQTTPDGQNVPTLYEHVSYTGGGSTKIISPWGGYGMAHADVIGGNYASLFNWEGDPWNPIDKNGDGILAETADGFLKFNFSPDTRYGFDGDSNDPYTTQHLPEPTSMLLFGIGIVGLATLKRKKKVA